MKLFHINFLGINFIKHTKRIKTKLLFFYFFIFAQLEHCMNSTYILLTLLRLFIATTNSRKKIQMSERKAKNSFSRLKIKYLDSENKSKILYATLIRKKSMCLWVEQVEILTIIFAALKINWQKKSSHYNKRLQRCYFEK